MSLTPLMKKHIGEKLKKTSRYIREITSSLESKNALFKITTQDIILNPSYFYKGGTKIFKTKLQTYLKYKNEKKNIDIINDNEQFEFNGSKFSIKIN